MLRKLLMTLAALSIATSIYASAADDGAALYKGKCAGCHGASGEGKSAMKAPPLKATDKTLDQLIDHITKGEPTSKPPHNKGMAGVTDEQAKAIAEYVKSLQ